jgi:hypothetical protein
MKTLAKNNNRERQGTTELDKHVNTLENLSGDNLKIYLVNLWMVHYTAGFFGTLSFNRSFYFERGFGCVDDFVKGILQKVHGQRWHKRIRRSHNFVVYGFIEYNGENIHLHFGVWGEEEELNYLREHCNEVWKEHQPQGDCSTEKIKEVFAAADYSFKTVENRDSQASLYAFCFPSQQCPDRAKNMRKPDKTENRAKILGNRVEKWLKLRGKISNTKKNRGKTSRHGGDRT